MWASFFVGGGAQGREFESPSVVLVVGGGDPASRSLSFNYLSCVTTNPGTHTSAIYTRLTWEASESGAVAKADWEDYALASRGVFLPILRTTVKSSRSETECGT